MRNHTAAIVVTYNRKELLAECIDAILAQTVPCDVLIINNASTDGTVDMLQRYRGQDRVLCHNAKENLGGAAGFYEGIALAVQRGYEFLWIMDDDSLPKSDALQKLEEAGKGRDFGFLASKIFWIDGKLCQMNVQKKTPYRDVTNWEQPLAPIAMSSFVSLYLKASTVMTYGLPIREFFIWTDDWEFTRRISRREPCYLVTDSHVIHQMKNNSIVNIARDVPQRLARYRYAYRNDVVLYRREGLLGWAYLVLKDLWHTAQVLLKAGDGKGERLRILWKGFWEGVHFKPQADMPTPPEGKATPPEVLLVVSTLCRAGGVETFDENAFGQLRKLGCKARFLVLGIYEDDYVQDMREMGAEVDCLSTPVKDTFAEMLRRRKLLRQYFRAHPVHLAHFMTCSQSVMIPLYYAKRAGIPKRVVHSHVASRQGASLGKRLANGVAKHIISKNTSMVMACSMAAGRHMFTNTLLGSNRFALIPNGIDTRRFDWQPSLRQRMRQQLGYADQLVVGFVGRLSPEKNLFLLLDSFAVLLQKQPEAKLLMVGGGEQREALQAHAKKIGIAADICWVGRQTDVEAYMQAMDVMVLPSLFEGLGIVTIEAQCGGLPCVVSDGVPEEVELTPLVSRCALAEPPQVWAEAMLRAADVKERVSWQKTLEDKGYSDEQIGQNLLAWYYRLG